MKIISLIFCLIFTVTANGQQRNEKLSNDSVRYYRKELNKLWQSDYDSLKNSENYKFLTGRLGTKNYNDVTVELLVNAGFYIGNYKNLNARLQSLGQKEVNTLTPGLGVSFAIGRPIMTYGVELNAYVGDNSTASLKGRHGRFFLATNLFKKSIIVLNPQIGFTTSYLNMFITRSSEQTNFDDLFSGQANRIQLSHSQNYLDFALGLKFRTPKSENFYWQFFRAGYRYALKDVAWKSNGREIINAPIDRNNQYYFQLCIGFDR